MNILRAVTVGCAGLIIGFLVAAASIMSNISIPVDTVRALAPPECEAPEVVFLPFPVRVPFYGGRSKGQPRATVDPWECWFSDTLDDWMCPVPAGAPWSE